jgi:predicted nucleotidyltransferase component of viral defense system
MHAWNDIQAVELFHLIFLDLLGRKVDRRHYALKGGCNLRFFLRSFRYSEDMDIDVWQLPPEKLSKAVEGILRSDTFARILGVKGISMQKWTAPKQTETTQRWKFLLAVTGRSGELNTKVEFSRRGASGEPVFAAIDPLLLREYAIGAIMASHYPMQAAFAQKIEALASRKTTQARDIFDLHLLLRSGASPMAGTGTRRRMHEAAERALSVPFAVFRSQVLSYLHPDWREQYDAAPLWQDMALRVAEALTEEPSP